MIRLAAQGLSLQLGGRRIVWNVSFEARGGEFVALIGPNGAGTSSLLTLLAGLAAPTVGHVLIDDTRLATLRPDALARRRAYLPQNPRCDWPIPVERLVGLGLTPLLPSFGDFTVQDRARIDGAIAACDLESHRLQAATTLSGGELARAMLARAIVGDPQLLIIDEPLAGLDPRHAIDTVRRLRALAVDEGRLVIAAMHDLNLALRHATRVWALHAGCLVADGAPREVIDAALLQSLFDVTAQVHADADGPRVEFG
jgi:iron complex transport system ATP-binding protein